MASADQMAVGGFTIGDHASSRSIFGFRRSQIGGEIIGIICGFGALLLVGSFPGLASFLAITVLASLGFLVGYRRRTLDMMLFAGACFVREGVHQKRRQFRFELFGFAVPPSDSSYLVSKHNYGSARISNTRQRRAAMTKVRTPGMEIRSAGEVRLEDGTLLGMGKDRSGRRCVVAFEVFGNDFLFQERVDQLSRTFVFGRVLGTMSSLTNVVDSVVLLYAVDPVGEAGREAAAEEWPDELRSLYLDVKEKSVVRRSYVIVRLRDARPCGSDYLELVSFISGLGVGFRALDARSLIRLFSFGSAESAFKGVLHMRSLWGHLLVGERMMKMFDVVELPTGEVQPDFLVPFVASLASQSLLGFELKVIDSRFALRKVRSRRSGITADAGIRALMGFLARNSEARAITSLEVQENDLDMGYEMFSLSGYFAIFADDLAGLKAATQDAVAKAEKSGLVLECAYGRQLNARHRLFGGAL